MKKILIVALIIIVGVSCNNKKEKSVIDPIWETQPVNQTYTTGFPLEKFHELGLANDTSAQKNLVNEYRKLLTMNVINNHPCIKDENNVKFVFGSGEVKKVLSGDGKTYDGKFKNELIIILNDPCIKDTLFLACGNGMMTPIRWEKQSNWGNAEKCRYEILPGQGLAHHMPELEKWTKVADDLSIPIRDKNGTIVPKETYLHYLGKFESILFPGDIIDMCQGKVFNKAGQEVEFERRIQETKKANERAAKKTKKKSRKK